jgi:hypothetical protein
VCREQSSKEDAAQGKIAIDLAKARDARDRIGPPDLAHDAYWLAKQIRDLVWVSKSGEEVRMDDCCEVTGVTGRKGLSHACSCARAAFETARRSEACSNARASAAQRAQIAV